VKDFSFRTKPEKFPALNFAGIPDPVIMKDATIENTVIIIYKYISVHFVGKVTILNVNLFKNK